MFFYEGQTCPVCGRRFTEHDDIVTCPQCGCPHHRDCWKQEGHCHFAADHGTDRQWAKDSASASKPPSDTPQNTCPHCGAGNPEFAEFCAHCGKELDHEDWASAPDTNTNDTVPPPPVGQYTPPFNGGFAQPFQVPLQDPYGGAPRTEDIDGVPVDEIAELVGSNSAYYLPRFYKMTHDGSKVSWNWAAFLIPSNWLLYRKNLMWGILLVVVETALQLFSQIAGNGLYIVNTATNAIAFKPLSQLMADPQAKLLLIVLFVASIASLVLSILMGMFGNYLYLQSILKKAKRRQENPQLKYDRSFLNTGGTSFALAIAPELLVIVIEYVQILLTMFV